MWGKVKLSESDFKRNARDLCASNREENGELKE